MPPEEIDRAFRKWLSEHYWHSETIFTKGDMRAAWGAALAQAGPCPTSHEQGPDTHPLGEQASSDG